MSLTIFKVINIKSTDFNIYKDNTSQSLLFDLHIFSIIHSYHNLNYLVYYYGSGKNSINIFYGKYTDLSGMVNMCGRARKEGVKTSFNIILKELDFNNMKNINIKLIDTPENIIITEIKEYFGKLYKYVNQYSIGNYRIDLVIKNDSGLDVAIEIDENHHNTRQQERADQIRESEIKEIYDCHFVRIKVDSSDNKDYLNTIRRLLMS